MWLMLSYFDTSILLKKSHLLHPNVHNPFCNVLLNYHIFFFTLFSSFKIWLLRCRQNKLWHKGNISMMKRWARANFSSNYISRIVEDTILQILTDLWKIKGRDSVIHFQMDGPNWKRCIICNSYAPFVLGLVPLSYLPGPHVSNILLADDNLKQFNLHPGKSCLTLHHAAFMVTPTRTYHLIKVTVLPTLNLTMARKRNK